MSHESSMWLRKQTGWWMTTINGVQHKLDKDEGAAKKVFYKLMAKDAPATSRPAERRSAQWLCDKFLDRTKEAKTSDTFRIQREHLTAFCKTFGARSADSLKAHEVNEWLDQRDWASSTKALGVTIIKAVFNWSVNEDYLTESPLKKLKRRKVARRDRFLTAAEERALLSDADGCFRDFIVVLLKTGMRPFSEAAKLTAKMIDWAEGRAILKEHKNAGKGKSRVVYFAPEVLDILKRLTACHPDGPLLRNARDAEWKRDTMHDRIRRVCDDAGIDHFTAYTLRHTYISNALVKGVPVEVVAELVGTSPKMIWTHYSQLNKMGSALSSAALKAVS